MGLANLLGLLGFRRYIGEDIAGYSRWYPVALGAYFFVDFAGELAISQPQRGKLIPRLLSQCRRLYLLTYLSEVRWD